MGKCDTCGKKKYGYLCEGCIHDPDAMDKYEPMTNADRIRAMSDEELAELLLNACIGSKCGEQPTNEHGSIDCFACRLTWLKQPVQEGDNG